ncbi:hypothetical protein PCANC_12370 [Puccinia coronata f. sp. avenae]|uniref:Uncharacterized protein n=1 Tax=Puccinia coronata f. sp. avenae TaxID=200324 RepID=A0A2N5TN25_9BASI|nr:hypothetical protein PCANC_27035 [Puccinia coronata f. sp. avenae]PLW41143.1 hypothetical protein PCANC_12370 [Puccinia coronata f. sp. avenae]
MSTSSKPQKVTLDDREFPLRGPEPLEADRATPSILPSEDQALFRQDTKHELTPRDKNKYTWLCCVIEVIRLPRL